MPFPHTTALQNTCVLKTPSELLNRAFVYAKDNIARTMRYYTLGWGMSNAPHNYTLVVGRDTGWMTMGTDYVAPWFAPEALRVFRDRQKPNGQILEYIDMESGKEEDYGLNVADNTPLYMWGVWHHWSQFANEKFRTDFLPSMRAAADFLISQMGPRDLIVAHPAGVETSGIASWRNIIPGAVIAGEVTELNCMAAVALGFAAMFAEEDRYREAADRIDAAINAHLWTGENYLLNVYEGVPNPQVTGDSVFPLLFGNAEAHHEKERFQKVKARLEQPDFWNEHGLRTLPNTDPQYDPSGSVGLLGGSWPNLTLWYAFAVARHDPDRALAALEMVAHPVVEEPEGANVNGAEFPEYFHGDSGVNLGMKLSPWVAPTFIVTVMEGLLGLTWENGEPKFKPHWPASWDEVTISNLPCGNGNVDVTLKG